MAANFWVNRLLVHCVFILVLAITQIGANEPTTPEPTTPEPRYCQDYSPCCCSEYSNQLSVTCSGVSVETVRDVFQRVNDQEIYNLYFNPLADETNIVSLPADILGNTRVTSSIGIRTYFNCPNLVIDTLAFRASQNSLTDFFVTSFNFDLQKDFNFLSGFNKLEELGIFRITNFTAFQYLPPLPSLQKLKVHRCPDLNHIPFPDLSHAKLKKLELWGNRISDEKADEIVAKLADSTSADSLKVLDLWNNSLTRIPSNVGATFPKLKEVQLGNNKISHIPSSSLNFTSPYLELLHLSSNGLKKIESGAFEGKLTSERARKNNITRSTVFIIGNFTMTEIDLGSNQLDVFEEGVFKEMLQQMVSVQPPIGGVNIGKSIFFNAFVLYVI